MRFGRSWRIPCATRDCNEGSPMNTSHFSQPQTRWGVVMIIWAAGLGAAAQYGKISVIFDRLGLLYPGAGSSLSLTVTMVGVLGILLGVVAGGFVASFGYRRSLVWALWIGAAMSALQALHLPYGLFLATRLIEGLSHLGIVVAAPTLIPQICSPRHRGTALSIWSTFFGVSFALLVWFGLPLVAGFGLLSLFGAHALVMAVLAVVLGRVLKTVQVPPRLPLPKLADLPGLHLEIYRSAAKVAPAAGWLFYTTCFVALLTVLPPHLDPAVRVGVISAMPLVSIATSMTLGVWLLRRMAAVRVVQAGFLLATGGAVWLLLMPGLPLACMALAVAFGLVQGASFASVPQLNVEAAEQAQSNGAMSQAGNMGNAIGTPLMVAAVAVGGYHGMMMLALVLFLGGFAVHTMLARRRGQTVAI
ncbi:MFS transporter [Phaeobacter inhibens]|uniref:MFS transporter n=1 Tax=Phaeobacter inhibens TaxID=221822 RepID=UPI0021A3D068|nr:MFS transporter [Phaeobacter inhibens]UWS01901.1 MFS transporter [Phaeobacter inhibens]